MPRVALLGLDGAQLSGIAGLLDALTLANRYAAQQYQDLEIQAEIAQARVVSLTGRPIRLWDGRSFPADASIAANDSYDLVYVAPFEVGQPFDLDARMAGLEAAAAWLKRQRQDGAIIAGSGVGVALMAEAGLLGGVVATVPWWMERAFRRRYPAVELDIARIIAEADGIFCGGTTRSEPALALRLIEKIASPNVANWVAKITLIDPHPDGPEPWTVFSPRVLRQDGLVGRAQHWLQLRFSQKARLGDLAQALAVSERTLVRRFERSLGMTPLDYLQLLRVEAAKQMLNRSNRKIDRIGYLVGYSDPGFFKKVFKARTGLSPSLYRRRHASPGGTTDAPAVPEDGPPSLG